MDNYNDFGVSRNANGILIQRCPLPTILNDADAVNLAAWLIAMVPDGTTKLHEQLTQIMQKDPE